MLYCYICPKCSSRVQLIRTVSERANIALCTSEGCTTKLERDYQAEHSEVAVLNDELKTDFGAGEGERAYTRKEYKDKCKELDRDPVGLLWQ